MNDDFMVVVKGATNTGNVQAESNIQCNDYKARKN